jgi:PleD family two-component response regulator
MGQKTILCIDDSQKAPFLRTRVLDSEGYCILQVKDVDMASRACELFEVDLVITAQQFSEVESVELEKIKARIKVPLVLSNEVLANVNPPVVMRFTELYERVVFLLSAADSWSKLDTPLPSNAASLLLSP